MMAMTYGNVYVAQVAMGANDAQTVRAFLEAEAYDGPSLIIAYSHCIAHGIDMAHGHGPAEAGGRFRPLAALPLRPAAAAAGQESAAARFARVRGAATRLLSKREALSMLTQSDPAGGGAVVRGAQDAVQSVGVDTSIGPMSYEIGAATNSHGGIIP